MSAFFASHPDAAIPCTLMVAIMAATLLGGTITALLCGIRDALQYGRPASRILQAWPTYALGLWVGEVL